MLGSSGRGLATWTTGIYTTYHVSYALVVIGTSKKAIELAKSPKATFSKLYIV